MKKKVSLFGSPDLGSYGGLGGSVKPNGLGNINNLSLFGTGNSKTGRNIPKKQMSYYQAKKKYPKMDPFGDIDGDGVINMNDCRPFDAKKQGFWDIFKKKETSDVANPYQQTPQKAPGFFKRTFGRKEYKPIQSASQVARYESEPPSEYLKQENIEENKSKIPFKQKAYKAPPKYSPYTKEYSVRKYEIEEKARKKDVERLQAQERYDQSKSGKVTKIFLGGVAAIKNPTKALYRKTSYVNMTVPSGGVGPASRNLGSSRVYKRGRGTQGRPGRPAGTYDQRYAKYGGVYGWRKAQALENLRLRLAYRQQANINPQQQMYIQQMEARERAQAQNIEARPIPNTQGRVQMAGIMDEINDAANAVN